MKLLALDAGFTTGYAVVEPGMPPITGSHPIPGSADELGHACHAFGHLVKALIEEHSPTAVVLCTPYISSFAIKTATGLDRSTPNIGPTKILFGMYGMAKAVCWSLGIPVYDLYEPSVRKAFGVRVPKGTPKKLRHKALKDAVVAACTARRWYVPDDHAGDAMLAAAFKLGNLLMPKVEEPSLPLPKPRRRKKAA